MPSFRFGPQQPVLSLLLEASSSVHAQFLDVLKIANGLFGMIYREDGEAILLEKVPLNIHADFGTFPSEKDAEANRLDSFVENILQVRQHLHTSWIKQGDPVDFYFKWVEPLFEKFNDSDFIDNIQELSSSKRESLANQIQKTLGNTDVDILDLLMEYLNWRYQLVGIWLCGFGKREKFTPIIGEKLLKYFPSLSYCFALARIGNAESIQYLETYGLPKTYPNEVIQGDDKKTTRTDGTGNGAVAPR
ncbi:MAG: hypothetical protein DPW16_22505, partial [Chloroflexi bacterium]|nr:hypothetical protein [Chloroflexota bacterium]